MQDAKVERQRIRIIMVLIVIVGALVVLRLFSLQVVKGSHYKERAERQYITPTSDVFDRGNIYFTSKNGTTVAAATVTAGFRVAIAPNLITNPEDTFEKINAIIPLDRERFFMQAQKKNDPYEVILERVPYETGEKIAALKIPGVTLYRQKWRFYPGEFLASKTIGFVSYKNNVLAGNYGLEEYYNDVLVRNGNDLYVNFFAEIFANMKSTIFKNRAIVGDIKTTIEPTVQAELEQSVSNIEKKWNSDGVGAIVMDPKTGEIIAIAHAPGFNLNKFGEVDNVATYNNPFVQSVYEMGSIVKPLVVAAALDIDAITPTTTYTDKGFVVVNNKTINNFDKKGRGVASMQDVLNQSLNTGMVFIEQKMGRDRFREYMLDKYKVGEKTNVDLPGEVNGLVSNLRGNNDVNFATASFGQGVATTPLNIVRSFAVLANGGSLVTPHVVSSIEEEGGNSKPRTYETIPGVLKPETASTITNMLVKVVDEGYNKKNPQYRIAAKTGTAQIAKPNGGGYFDDRNLHSLMGYFPASNPRFVVYFFNVYPKGAQYAIETLSDPFFGMIQFLGNYYEIAPDR